MRIDLDDWLSDPQVVSRHVRRSAAPPGELWRAASRVRVRDAPVLGRAVRWRIPGTPAEITFRRLLAAYPFAVLAEGDDWSVSGVCGRLWTLRRDYPRLAGPRDFEAWSEAGTVRAVVAHWVEPADDGGSIIVSESRIQPLDRRAALRMRALWAVVGRFERLIGGEALGVAVRLAAEA